jgi:hypothetical protein
MDVNRLLKKLNEIKVDAYNNVHSADEESKLQVYDGVWGRLPLDEDTKGEDVKVKRPKAEKVKVPETLSRTTPMAGPTKHNPSEKVYVTDGTTKKSTREQLDAFKEFLNVRKDLPYEGGETPDLERSLQVALNAAEAKVDWLLDNKSILIEQRDEQWFNDELGQAEWLVKELSEIMQKEFQKMVKKNDPMTTAKLILEEGSKNSKEAEIHLMLEDAVDKNNVDQVQQLLMMLPQGM